MSDAAEKRLDRGAAPTAPAVAGDASCAAETLCRVPQRRLATARRRSGEQEADCGGDHKLHWTHLTKNGSSKDVPRQNGKVPAGPTQAQERQAICRRDVRVRLTNVLKTEAGCRYLRQSGRGQPTNNHAENSLRINHSQTQHQTQPHNQPKAADQLDPLHDSKAVRPTKTSQSPNAPRPADPPPPERETSAEESSDCMGSVQFNPIWDEEGSTDGQSRSKSKGRRASLPESGSDAAMREEECLPRESVLRLSGEEQVAGRCDGQAAIKRPRLTGLADDPSPNPRRITDRTASQSSQSEPIVLSSEDETDDETPQQQEEQVDMAVEEKRDGLLADNVDSEESTDQSPLSRLEGAAEGTYEPEFNQHPLEMAFTSLLMAGVRVLAGGTMEVSCDQISFPLKDSVGGNVTVVMPMADLYKYSVLRDEELKESRLVRQGVAPPPSLLLFWVSEKQAHNLINELSIIQPGTRLAEGSRCVCVCLSDTVQRLETTLLGSIIDLVALKMGVAELLVPPPLSSALEMLRSSPHDAPLLQMLDLEQDEAETLATADREPELQPVYTLRHCRTSGRYPVSLATKPGPEWVPYCHRAPPCRLIQFPPPPCKGAITVTTEDLECLDSGEFLNDVIIDFYLKYLMVEKAPCSSVERCHVFSSFFYKQLTRKDNANEDNNSTPAPRRRHQRVKTWTRNVDIFNKDFLFVPVNQEAHWYLVVICFPGLQQARTVLRDGVDAMKDCGEENSADHQGDEAGTKDEGGAENNTPTSGRRTASPLDCTEKTCKKRTVCQRPCILIMDSLKVSAHERVHKLLREYLEVEWEVRRGERREFNAELMPGSHCTVPLQDNSSDCGLYLLQFAESFLQDPVVHFDLPLRMERWFPRQQVRRKRDEIRDLVLLLCRYQRSVMGDVCQTEVV